MAETIFMIHGMWAGAWVWDDYREFFENRGYECVAPPLRFHDVPPGTEPDPRLGTTSLLDYAQDLENQISRLPTMPILMGHSMGGLLAQILASRGLARMLVLLTSAPPAGVIPAPCTVVNAGRLGMLPWSRSKAIRPTWQAAAGTVLQRMSPESQKKMYDGFGYESGLAAYEMGFWFLDPRRASWVDGAKVTCPVLAVAGKEDRLIPPFVVRQIARKYGSVSTYKEFRDHGHMVNAEPGWQGVANYIAEWLDLAGRRAALDHRAS